MQTSFDRNNWPIAGSTSYYALLHCPDHAVGNALATLELIASIADALANVNEGTVAEQKVHWWHEELARLAKGQARHPSTQKFQNLMAATSGDINAIKNWVPDLLTVLSCNANERFSNAATDDLFEQRINDDYCARLRLLSRSILAPDSKGSDETLLSPVLITNELIFGLGLFDRLRQFYKLQAGGAMVWPDTWYAQHDLEPEHLHEAQKKPQLMQLFASAGNTAIKGLENGLSTVWQHEPASQVHLSQPSAAIITAATLRLAQLKMWQRKQPDLLRQYHSLTPLRKSLLTWRTQRKLARLQTRVQKF